MAPASITLVLQKITFLNVIKKFEWVDGGPGQPGPLSKAATTLLLSSLVRDLSAHVSDPEISREVRSTGKEMAEVAIGGLIAGWEDGDDWCPPLKPPKWPPGPGPWPWLEALRVFDPEPVPWFEAAGARLKDGIIGFALQQIAALTPDEQLAGQVNDVAMKLQG